MKAQILLIIGLLTIIAFPTTVSAEDSVTLTETTEHHVIELNSDQLYIAGFHVNTENLNTREHVDATAIAVSFPSTDSIFFPQDSWLAGGMFVQAQDTTFRNIDYGFYIMLAVDDKGNLFIDLGLHQTREETAPIQKPTETLVYAYTWRITGITLTTSVLLCQSWDSEGNVHYSASIEGTNHSLTTVNIPSLPDCQNIIRKFYAGNVIVYPFPFSRYVNYYQFGIVSSQPITNSHWKVHLKAPSMQRKTGWVLVDKAWSVQGDASYLDWSWRWGGTPYNGVDAQHYQNPLENPYELIFQYTGNSLIPGRVLWKASGTPTQTSSSVKAANNLILQARLMVCIACYCCIIRKFSNSLVCCFTTEHNDCFTHAIAE